jgi:3-phosphoshikimate 1-carboxyvinyltransferase
MMGCLVETSPSLVLHGAALRGITIDLKDAPDAVPALAMAAACAEGVTEVHGVAHLRLKESDRLTALQTLLGRTGIRVEPLEDGLRIYGGEPRGVAIDPHNDHRIAMAFAILGLRARGMMIDDPECVAKSYPDFWSDLEELCRSD